MQHNPFTSSIFETVWSKHFLNNQKPITFKAIKNVVFCKSNRFPFYVNIGKNLTKGVNYEIDYSQDDFKGKTFLIYDVPEYFNVKDLKSSTKLQCKKVYQYTGSLMNIEEFASTEEYINNKFSSKNRREFRGNIRKLETCFNISYKFINEALSQEEFDFIFGKFHDLLSIRFGEKGFQYHHLEEQKWNYYRELVFKMLQTKQASLLVISHDEEPIGITLNFHSETVLFETITVFDPDYFKFSVGKTSIIKLLDWCFENNFKISDFSKGAFDYKEKWGNLTYKFNYHILYDSSSLQSRLTASALERFFKLKLYLREKDLGSKYRKLKHKFSGNAKATKPVSEFKIEKLETFTPDETYKQITVNKTENKSLRKYLFMFLFANPEPENNVKVYEKEGSYYITGTKKSMRLVNA